MNEETGGYVKTASTESLIAWSAEESEEEDRLNREVLREELPRKMLVAVDGCSQSGKFAVGELVAYEIDAQLVDSGRFYRAITRACLDAKTNLDDETAVARFCESSLIDVRFQNEGGLVNEAQIAIDQRWYTKDDLKSLEDEVSNVAKVCKLRDLVNYHLRRCENGERVVIVGRDIGTFVFPDTPFKFILDAPRQMHGQRNPVTAGVWGTLGQNQIAEVVVRGGAMVIANGSTLPVEDCGEIVFGLCCMYCLTDAKRPRDERGV